MTVTEGMVTTQPLAHRADFQLARAQVRPSLRTLEGPGGNVSLEPKVMQVLLAFADADGAVITRDDLARACWGGRIIGEDAVNRTIGELRKAARESEAGFTIETIPRVGYRLDQGDAGPSLRSTVAARPRRRTVAAMLLGGLAAGGAALLWRERSHDDRDRRAQIDRARRALHDGLPDSGVVAERILRKLVQGSADDAETWGLLAYAYRNIAEGADPEQVSAAIQASEDASRRGLALDPRQGDALAAQAALRPYFGDHVAGEDRLLRAITTAPGNFLAMEQLVGFYQGVGLIQKSVDWNERAAERDPNSPIPQYRRALKLWSQGQRDAADQAMDRVMQLWPRHPSVWNARMLLFAFTGRPAAGLALLDDERSRPAFLKPAQIDLWRVSLRALETRSPADLAAARDANIRAAPRSPGFANNALMTLSMLGDLDAAFDVADGYFLRRGPLITSLWEGAGELPVSALRWRRSMALFVPPAAPMRADPRFMDLMEGMGIADYWRRRNVRPDYQRAPARTAAV